MDRIVSSARARGCVIISFPPLRGVSSGRCVGSDRAAVDAIGVAVCGTAVGQGLRGRDGRDGSTVGSGRVVNDDYLLGRLAPVELVPIDGAVSSPLSRVRRAVGGP